MVGSFAGVTAAATSGQGIGEQWLTSVTSPTALKLGTGGLTIAQSNVAVGTCAPGVQTGPFSATTITYATYIDTFIVPAEPVTSVTEEQHCDHGARNSVTETLSHPVLDPIFYVVGLHTSLVTVSGVSTTGSPIVLKAIAENNRALTPSNPNVINPQTGTTSHPTSTGCTKTTMFPPSACGSFLLTAAHGDIQTFSINRTSANTLPSTVHQWADSFSYPYETSIVPSFSTATIAVGSTNTLTFTIEQHDNANHIWESQICNSRPSRQASEFSSVTSDVGCGTATDNKGNNTSTPPTAGSTGFGENTITVAKNSTCVINIKVKATKSGTPTITHGTITTTAWNLVNTSSATFRAHAVRAGAPTITSVTAGNGSVTVHLTPPVTGDDTITTYVVQAYATTNTLVSTTTTVATTPPVVVVNGLINGRQYKFKAAAINGLGTGAYSSLTATSTTPHGSSTAPTGVTAVANSTGSVTILWAKPATNGTTITGYLITPHNTTTNTTAAAIFEPVTPTKAKILAATLVMGDKYTFKVKAQATPDSATSAASNAVTPNQKPTTPGAPTTSTVGSKKVKVTWSAPTDNGSAITHYVIEAIGATNAVVATKTVTAVITSTFTTLTNGKRYTFKVAAQNAAGTSTFSPCFEPIGHAPYKADKANRSYWRCRHQ